MRKASALVAAIGLVLCMGLVTAAPAMAETGIVEGRVTEPEEEEGQAEVEVCAEPATAADPAGACVKTEDGSGLGPRGHYELALEPGTYVFSFTPPEESIYVYQYFFRTLRRDGARPVEVESGGLRTINAVLDVGGRVSGEVTDTSGIPMAEVKVCIFDTLVPEFGTHCTETPANGRWGMIGLPSGSYAASFTTPEDRNVFPQYFNLSPDLEGASEFVILPGEETTGIDAKLEAGVAIAGAITEAGTDVPLAGIRACALDPASEAAIRCATSEADGKYRISLLHPQSYVVGFSVTGEEGGMPMSSQEDGYVRQYFEDEPSFAAADPINATQPGIYNDVDAHLSKGPEVFPRPSSGSGGSSSAGPAVPLSPIVAPRTPRCRKHHRAKAIKGKRRCVKIHKARRRHHHHHGGS